MTAFLHKQTQPTRETQILVITVDTDYKKYHQRTLFKIEQQQNNFLLIRIPVATTIPSSFMMKQTKQRQNIVGVVKMKDRYLHNEVISILPKYIFINEYVAEKWDNVYNNLLQQNVLVLSKMKDKEGWTILHHACEKHAPEYVSNFIIENCRNAIKEKADDGSYPLHLACIDHQSETVVLQLFEAFPSAAKCQSTHGFYPLHLACANKQSETVVLRLFEAFPTAAKHQDDYYGQFPLHYACEHNQSETVVLRLLEAFPTAAICMDCAGRFPLHMACENNQSETVLHQLLTEFPYASRRKETLWNMYPLHIACARNVPLSIVKLLVFHYPRALDLKAGLEKRTPLEWALCPEQGKDPIAENVEFLMDYIAKKQAFTSKTKRTKRSL